MKLILEIRDKELGLKSKKPSVMKRRDASRAVLIKGRKKALLNVTRQKYHKLPGGGVEGKESIKEALQRELLEETGCTIKIMGEVGKIVEHRARTNVLQTSYCYIAKAIKEGKPKFDAGERRAGFRLEWVGIKQAMEALGNEKPRAYEGKFIVVRDLEILKAAKDMIKSKLSNLLH